MERIKKFKHFLATDTELDNVTWSCESNDILRDIKFLMREYYTGFYSEIDNGLIIRFNNGQKFKLTVSEIK